MNVDTHKSTETRFLISRISAQDTTKTKQLTSKSEMEQALKANSMSKSGQTKHIGDHNTNKNKIYGAMNATTKLLQATKQYLR